MAEKKQISKFVAAAKELGCGHDESAFDQTIKKIASAPPPKSVKKRKSKKPTK